jgi:hypothetical protein
MPCVPLGRDDVAEANKRDGSQLGLPAAEQQGESLMAVAIGQSAPITGRGRFDAILALDCHPTDVVLASVTEIDANNVPCLGLAPVRIDNVVPLFGKVHVTGFIDYSSYIRVRVSAFRARLT